MKRILIILTYCFISSLTYSQSISDSLIGTEWDVCKTIEIINHDTTIYEASILIKDGKTYQYFNPLGGIVKFDDGYEGTGRFCFHPGKWTVVGNQTLGIEIIQFISVSKSRHFFGNFTILSYSNEQMILLKNLSRDGKWTRKFYLTKIE